MKMFLKKIKKNKSQYCTAIVAAAGNSSRMGGVNKLLQNLCGVPVLARTLTSLQLASCVDEIIVAAREEDLMSISELCKDYHITKCTKVIRGGADRAHSVLRAALEAGPETEFLAVQDGARPLVLPEMIDRVIQTAEKCGAAAPAVAVKDTIKVVREDLSVKGTPNRDKLRAVQTPQVFQANILKAALQSAIDQNTPVTDDCSEFERLGKTVYLVNGDEENLKITTPIDMVVAEAILEERKKRK